MKKIIVFALLLFCFSFVSCDLLREDDKVVVDFQTGIYDYKNWDETIGTYRGDAIPNQQVASNVATEIFNGLEKSSKAQKYVLQEVFYDEQDEIWIVAFYEPIEENSDGTYTLGGGCNIALQKKDGKVLRIWFSE